MNQMNQMRTTTVPPFLHFYPTLFPHGPTGPAFSFSDIGREPLLAPDGRCVGRSLEPKEEGISFGAKGTRRRFGGFVYKMVIIFGERRWCVQFMWI